MDMKERLQELAENARKRIEESEGLDKLNDVRVAYLGKKGELTAILKKKKLKRRQCSSCGRFLPYNYPYGMCSDCYEEMQARRYERYYGYGNFEDY